MPWSFIVPAAISLFSANKQASAAKDAAASTAAATNEATQLQREMFQQQRQDQMPWMEAGKTALNALIPMATNYQKFGMDQFQQDPGYAFRLAEGQKALDRSAAARGGLISGGALKAAGRYGQEMGSQEYMNAFNRYQTERNAQLNPLQSLANVGQTTANQLGAAGQNYASNVGNALINQGANVGNARMAGASAYGSALSGIGSAYGRNPVSFGSLYGGGGGGYSGAGQVNPVSGEYMGSLEF
jgi:hypothetical protein